MSERVSRRAFLAGAGALAVSPLLPAIPAPAGEVVTVTKVLDAAWATGVDSIISNTTYHIWVVRTATGALDLMAVPKGKRAPKGFQKLRKYATITRETPRENQNTTLTQDTNKALLNH